MDKVKVKLSYEFLKWMMLRNVILMKQNYKNSLIRKTKKLYILLVFVIVRSALIDNAKATIMKNKS